MGLGQGLGSGVRGEWEEYMAARKSSMMTGSFSRDTLPKMLCSNAENKILQSQDAACCRCSSNQYRVIKCFILCGLQLVYVKHKLFIWHTYWRREGVIFFLWRQLDILGDIIIQLFRDIHSTSCQVHL